MMNNGEVPARESMSVKAGTYRLTTRAHRLIALAVKDARTKGRAASKGEAVEQAIRAAYSHLDTQKD